jgi:hypothetical protein
VKSGRGRADLTQRDNPRPAFATFREAQAIFAIIVSYSGALRPGLCSSCQHAETITSEPLPTARFWRCGVRFTPRKLSRGGGGATQRIRPATGTLTAPLCSTRDERTGSRSLGHSLLLTN